MTPEQARLRSAAGAHALFAKVDPVEHLAPARRGFMAKFETQVDPDRTLPEPERKRRADQAMRAHMKLLALKSSQARGKG